MTVRARRYLSVLLAFVFALGGGAVTAVAAPAAENYVALGDSYSSGVGAGSYGSSGDCMRSANAYPELWANSHSVSSFDFVACSGAKTADVLSQASAVDASTTFITVSVGGNDAGFADVMVDCTLSTNSGCVSRVEEAKQFATSTLPGRLDDVYSTLTSRAPNAQIVVLGYPRFYEIGGSCSVGLSDTKRSAINSGADTLAQVTADRAAAHGLTFVDMRGPFNNHEICASGEWWLHSLTWPVVESYHPTANGQRYGYLPALESVTG
ncbi:SGNH/GDSL hydrolase family protein [Saccharomonospora piscinae]|uniref:Lipase n=1 Tax=Saccharomonospora piscinae TaxID=687388 RepID=A0A1V9A5C9_SACPI|nr:SGNH/GDSL hydrolase family protein [Saccharomonospora piscinae]OQO92345.1 lipase [Saccharomonospora piscinae]TLW91942.1 SGNH/GDSL hydrolase family protein [Saccharomonospora piscinae]